MLREDTQHCLATLPRNIATQQCPAKKSIDCGFNSKKKC